MAYWANKVAKQFDLDANTIQTLWGRNDKHNTQWRMREYWKYGASIGVSGTPSAFINGVKIAE
tara:strand:+ start:227 stop:415 length:189 start_codon:yes stop_codon:yes gene_type:complete